MTIKLIVGIGNVGDQYTNTRHNCGHKYIQLLAKTYRINLKKNSVLFGYLGILKIRNFIVKLLIPDSYMNDSGLSVSKCVEFYQLSVSEILIVHDDLDLSPGMIRIKFGSKINNSHHGIKDIIKKLNNNCNFYRLRIGIGRPIHKNEIINFVLGKPSITENIRMNFIMNQSILHIDNIIFNKIDKFMNKLHGNIIL